MQQDGHATNARRVAPADLSTGTRPWHLGTTRPLPGLSRHRIMQVSHIDGAHFPPGPQRVLTPFYDPLVLKSGHALSQCSCAKSGVRVGEWEGRGWNMIPQDVQGIERRTRERAMTGRKERAIMINLTNARYVPNMEGGTMIGNTDPPQTQCRSQAVLRCWLGVRAEETGPRTSPFREKGQIPRFRGVGRVLQ
jgi:hypothetical protein